MNTTKIIKGVVNSGRYTVTAPIVKEDYGLYLQIEGVELPQTYEVDFSNSETSGTSVTMIGNADGVLIPRQFIASGKDVFAFLYHVGEDFGRTVYKFRIPNKVRPDRTNEEPTPTQQGIVDQAIAQLNAAAEKTAQDVQTTTANAAEAQRHAEEADQSAQDAEGSKTAAETAKNAAETARANARTSETNAALSASAAERAKQAAQSYAEQANGSAETSILSANRAEQAANNAGYMDVDVVNGRLVYTRTDAVDTDLSLANGRLIMRAI